MQQFGVLIQIILVLLAYTKKATSVDMPLLDRAQWVMLIQLTQCGRVLSETTLLRKWFIYMVSFMWVTAACGQTIFFPQKKLIKKYNKSIKKKKKRPLVQFQKLHAPFAVTVVSVQSGSVEGYSDPHVRKTSCFWVRNLQKPGTASPPRSVYNRTLAFRHNL